MKEKTKFWFKFFALAFLIASTLIFWLIFTLAYVNPEKTITININSFGEANVELLIFIIIGIPVTIIGTDLLVKQVFKLDRSVLNGF